MPSPRPSRRQFLQSALAATALRPAGAQAERGLAYQLSPWSGPLVGFSLVDTAGKTWRPADFKGRSVLLNFWASCCEPCRAEMPSLQQAADLHGPDRLLVLAISFKERPERVLQFARSTGLTLPLLLDVNGQAASRWGVRVFPTTLGIDTQEKPALRVQGEMDWTGKSAEKLITGLFSPKPDPALPADGDTLPAFLENRGCGDNRRLPWADGLIHSARPARLKLPAHLYLRWCL